jgi:Spy/CpxP family protein refolding chaperone
MMVNIFSLFCMLAPPAVLAQMGGPGMRDALAPLKHALSDAGAPALTSTQETQLNALITAFRSAHQPQADTVLQSAQRAYEAAILNGDNASAQAQADIIANETANISRTNLKDRAKLEIDALNVLKSNDDQVGFLLKRIGSSGLAHLLGSLAGAGGPGPGGFRPGPGGPLG